MGLLKIAGFTGMDNVSGGSFKDGVLTPQFLINALPSSVLKLNRREGSTNKISLANAHSMWQGSIILCVADNVLYSLDLDAETSTSLGSVGGAADRMYYVELDDVIYLSNKHWCGALESSTLRIWGQSVIDEEAKDWVRHTNGSEYFENDTSGNPGFTIRGSQFYHAPNPMNYITEAFGRIWGVIGKKLVYSDAISFEWFQDDVNNFEFNDIPKMVAKGKDELYIGFDNKTAILSDKSISTTGLGPGAMNIEWFNQGVVEHTLQYCNFGGKLGFNTPMWLSKDGIMIGSGTSIFDISDGKVKYDVDEVIGSGFYMYKGEPLYLATMLHNATRVNADKATHEWITKHI